MQCAAKLAKLIETISVKDERVDLGTPLAATLVPLRVSSEAVVKLITSLFSHDTPSTAAVSQGPSWTRLPSARVWGEGVLGRVQSRVTALPPCVSFLRAATTSCTRQAVLVMIPGGPLVMIPGGPLVVGSLRPLVVGYLCVPWSLAISASLGRWLSLRPLQCPCASSSPAVERDAARIRGERRGEGEALPELLVPVERESSWVVEVFEPLLWCGAVCG